MSKPRNNSDSRLWTNSGWTWTLQESKQACRWPRLHIKWWVIFTLHRQHIQMERLRHPRASAGAEWCWKSLTDPDKNVRHLLGLPHPPPTHTILSNWQLGCKDSPAVCCRREQTDEEARLTWSSGDPSCCNGGIRNRIRVESQPKRLPPSERKIVLLDCTRSHTSVSVKD